MSEQVQNDERPRLSFLAPEESGTGMCVHEIELNPAGTPLAPFKASRFTVEPGCASPPDSHSVHEIWMVAQGHGELLYDNKASLIGPSEVLYFEPPKIHQVRNLGTDTMIVFSIWWKD